MNSNVIEQTITDLVQEEGITKMICDMKNQMEKNIINLIYVHNYDHCITIYNKNTDSVTEIRPHIGFPIDELGYDENETEFNIIKDITRIGECILGHKTMTFENTCYCEKWSVTINDDVITLQDVIYEIDDLIRCHHCFFERIDINEDGKTGTLFLGS